LTIRLLAAIGAPSQSAPHPGEAVALPSDMTKQREKPGSTPPGSAKGG